MASCVRITFILALTLVKLFGMAVSALLIYLGVFFYQFSLVLAAEEASAGSASQSVVVASQACLGLGIGTRGREGGGVRGGERGPHGREGRGGSGTEDHDAGCSNGRIVQALGSRSPAQPPTPFPAWPCICLFPTWTCIRRPTHPPSTRPDSRVHMQL